MNNMGWGVITQNEKLLKQKVCCCFFWYTGRFHIMWHIVTVKKIENFTYFVHWFTIKVLKNWVSQDKIDTEKNSSIGLINVKQTRTCFKTSGS